MTIIDDIRADREDLARVLKKHTGIRKLVEDLYPDSSHFIYELLQNAEDTKATETQFTLTKAGLTFEHNGRPFDERDLWAITDIGEGAKADDDDKIGQFGVGFKAVFAYCETPSVGSPTFSFKITDLVLPSTLPLRPELGPKTRFDFPFNNPKKDCVLAYAEIEKGLCELAETTLLFLSHIQSIQWQIGQAPLGKIWRVQHSTTHFQVLKHTEKSIETSSHFLKFDQVVKGLEKQRVAVAYALDLLPNVPQYDLKKPLAKQLKIIAATPGRVAVYFPAEKEASGLRFHLHGPFVPELSRASIKETTANEPLFQQLAGVAAESLYQIRDLGLLTADFLSILPNPQDSIPPRYQCIRSAIVDEMNTRPLTPTYAKSHAPARHLLQARASLKDLLSRDDLEFLADYDEQPPQWTIGAAQKNTNADRFLNGLAITEWDTDKFVELLCQGTSEKGRFVGSPPRYVSEPDGDLMKWLSAKPLQWHQEFYSVLSEHVSNAGWQKQQLLNELQMLRIVRLSDGNYSVGTRCFWPTPGSERDEILPRVDSCAYTSGKSKIQQQNAKEFLGQLGVREVGEGEQVEAILNARYGETNFKPSKKDLKRFVALVEEDVAKANLFENYYIFKLSDANWGTPKQVFLDHPFKETGLAIYYDALGEYTPRFALADSYKDDGISVERFVRFAEAVGAVSRLEITATSCRANPDWATLGSVGGNWTSFSIDEDYTILKIEQFLANPSVAKSKLIWHSMVSLPESPNYLEARYQRNRTWGARTAPSQLVHHLTNLAWVPQSEGIFVKPADAVRTLLPEGFPFDAGWVWLKEINFSLGVLKKSEEQRQKEILAEELGFGNRETLERARRFAALPAAEQELILADQERKHASELPEHEPANPERRSRRVREQAADAPERRTEKHLRSVSVGWEAVKKEAEQYLRELYTDGDGETICQVCKSTLPFRLDDGSPYFEKVEFLPGLTKLHYQNYLALCPNHAAMFQHANGSSDVILENFAQVTGNEMEVILARKDFTIYLTRTHIADLNAVVEADKVLEKDGAGDVPNEMD